MKRETFTLEKDFISHYQGKSPNWDNLAYFTYKRTYARVKNGSREEFWETVRRVVEGCFAIQKAHCKKLKLPWSYEKAQKSAQKMYKKIWNFKFTPPGRGLWIMGTDHMWKNGSAALNNCGFVSTEDIHIKGAEAFCFMMDSLMLGVGVGFDTLGAGKIIIKEPQQQMRFTIPDSREGWVEALRLLLEAYFFGHRKPILDYSAIRPAGERIKGFGGISSGPDPLRDLFEDIDTILSKRIGKEITSTNILDIMNLIGKCVIAGNVRRSAEIALGYVDDEGFINAKQDKEKLMNHRWASNNSVYGYVGMDYEPIVEKIHDNGEPGIVWLENAKEYSRMIDEPDYKDHLAKGVNPCGEQTLESFELCNLVETYPSHHDSYKEFQNTLKYAYLYAKTVTLMNTHWAETNAVMLKNRRIGVSQTGITQAFARHGRRTILNWCNRGYNFLKRIDSKYSDWLCIPRSKKITTVKPSGTVSILAGVTPGIHYPHAEYFIRRVRISKNSDLVELALDAGYTIEEDKYSNNSYVIEFPVTRDIDRKKSEVSVWEKIKNAVDYQRYWSDNQVSITVTYTAEEKNQLIRVLEAFEDQLKSVTFLPIEENGYEQSPYEEITEEKYLEMTNSLTKFGSSAEPSQAEGEVYCDAGSCIRR